MAEEKSCFVVSPIGEEGSEIRERSDNVFEYIINPVLTKQGYECSRADYINKSGRITLQIFEELANADVVVGDLTGLNANVMYELGFRLTLNQPFIYIAKEGQRLPFDTSDLRTIFYRLDDVPTFEKAKDQLAEQIQEIDNKEWSPIVPLALLNRREQTEGDSQRQLLLSIRSGLDELYSRFDDVEDEITDIGQQIRGADDKALTHNFQKVLADVLLQQELAKFYPPSSTKGDQSAFEFSTSAKLVRNMLLAHGKEGSAGEREEEQDTKDDQTSDEDEQ